MAMGAENAANGAATNGAAPHDDRVDALRAEMAKANVDAYIVPSEDPHMVQNLPAQASASCLMLSVFV